MKIGEVYKLKENHNLSINENVVGSLFLVINTFPAAGSVGENEYAILLNNNIKFQIYLKDTKSINQLEKIL